MHKHLGIDEKKTFLPLTAVPSEVCNSLKPLKEKGVLKAGRFFVSFCPQTLY